jgi:hypothetical protein
MMLRKSGAVKGSVVQLLQAASKNAEISTQTLESYLT